jgi:hypothetical protein
LSVPKDLRDPKTSEKSDEKPVYSEELEHKNHHYQHKEVVSAITLVSRTLIRYLREYDQIRVLCLPNLHHQLSLNAKMTDSQAPNY